LPDRRSYLAAMGIDVWLMRASAQASADAVEESMPQPVVDSPERTRARATPAPTSSRREPRQTIARSAFTLADATVASARGDIAHMDWDALAQAVAACRACPLHAGRTQTVFGVGDRAAIGSSSARRPVREEDRRGEPFVGRAGQLLNSMLFASASHDASHRRI
jgi:DNA polymerase